MIFNHHKALKDIGVVIKDGLIPKTQKDFKHTLWRVKRYFSLERVKEAKGLFDIVFDIEWQDFKDNVESNYQKNHTDNSDIFEVYNISGSKFNFVRTLIYIYDSVKYKINSRWKAYKNYWQYGFWDYDETYSLDWTTTVYLYERVKRYKDLASNWVKLYPDDEKDTESLHKYKKIPVVVLRDISEIKENYDKDSSMFFKDEPNVVLIEYKDLYQYECIDIILDYLEKVIKAEQGQHIFEELVTSDKIMDKVMDKVGLDNNPVKDENGKVLYYTNPFESINNVLDEIDPDHMFWSCLEETYVNILQSYAFQIYGKIITSMWW